MRKSDKMVMTLFSSPSEAAHIAYRYYVPRHTIAASCFARQLGVVFPSLDPNVQYMIREELGHEIEADRRAMKCGGSALHNTWMECDRQTWLQCYEKMLECKPTKLVRMSRS